MPATSLHYIADDLGPEPTPELERNDETPIAWADWDWGILAHWFEVWT